MDTFKKKKKKNSEDALWTFAAAHLLWYLIDDRAGQGFN